MKRSVITAIVIRAIVASCGIAGLFIYQQQQQQQQA
jgi:hypothetical protein